MRTGEPINTKGLDNVAPLVPLVPTTGEPCAMEGFDKDLVKGT